jgi:hypothetical protein
MTIKLFNNSQYDSLFYHEAAKTGHPCKVRIGGGHIELSYEDDGAVVKYVGFEVGQGHFELRAPEVQGTATLHMFENGKYMEGHWREGQYHGMWRVTLG